VVPSSEYAMCAAALKIAGSQLSRKVKPSVFSAAH